MLLPCCICTVNIGDAPEANILSRTAYNLGRNFLAGLIVTDDIGSRTVDVLTDSRTADIFVVSCTSVAAVHYDF